MRRALPLILMLLLAGAAPAAGACSDGACLPGGGRPQRDCWVQIAGTALGPNWPLSLPGRTRRQKEVRCFDGDAGCDIDGEVDGACTFPVDLCLASTHPALAECTAQPVSAVTVASRVAETAALQSAVDALLPAAAPVCTSGQSVRVPLRITGSGAQRPVRAAVTIRATTAAGDDSDTLRLRCLPRPWPVHGYDPRNRRASANERHIGPANVGTLVEKWHFDIQAREGDGTHGVTSTPTVAHGMVFITSWNGRLYALRARDAKVMWVYDSEAGGFGLQSSATVTADGRVLIGDAAAVVHALDARTGTLLWKRPIGDPEVDHFWSSAAVANDRVFAGIASHSDNPCTRGRLVALDLATGTPLWERYMVPERVCRNDTAMTCTTDADCGGEPCVAARGAGVTATVALDARGETVYANTVGCYTFPSVGDSDSIMRLDAASGDIDWIRRVQPPEQFGYCTDAPMIECGSAAHCPSGTCTTKSVYHDFGFLNGPIVVDVDDGLDGTRRLLVSGSKDGTLYAFEEATGEPAWTQVVAATPVSPGFAGFGLFNGALGYAGQRFFGALFTLTPPPDPPVKHLMAFSAVDGEPVWEDEIGQSWGSAAIANGVLYIGTQAAPVLYAYDIASGARLHTFTLPAPVAGGATVVDGVLYVPYGVLSQAGGVIAYTLP